MCSKRIQIITKGYTMGDVTKDKFMELLSLYQIKDSSDDGVQFKVLDLAYDLFNILNNLIEKQKTMAINLQNIIKEAQWEN